MGHERLAERRDDRARVHALPVDAYTGHGACAAALLGER
jgi:hypothetical protein